MDEPTIKEKLPPCRYRMDDAISRHQFRCAHAQVHAEGSLVSAEVCLQCERCEPTSPMSDCQATEDARKQPDAPIGPGSELKRMLPWLSEKGKSNHSRSRLVIMNRWGSKGCRLNLESIATWLVNEARLRGFAADSFSPSAARALVQTAIGRFERKFPDGSLEPDL